MDETLSERPAASLANSMLTSGQDSTELPRADVEPNLALGASVEPARFSDAAGSKPWARPAPSPNPKRIVAGEQHEYAGEGSGIEQRTDAELLHVGCGTYAREKLPPVFRAGWREIRLDIDAEVSPDLVASITDMHVISDCIVDAVYSSHNIEHLYPHDVPLALQEFRRVLKPTGFAFIEVPDLQEVARFIAAGKLEEPLYISPMGPIAALDIMYGHRPSLADGNPFMAHRTGFTGATLGAALIKAGFAAAMVQRDSSTFGLTAIAFRSKPSEDEVAKVQARILPVTDLPAILYTPVT